MKQLVPSDCKTIKVHGLLEKYLVKMSCWSNIFLTYCAFKLTLHPFDFAVQILGYLSGEDSSSPSCSSTPEGHQPSQRPKSETTSAQVVLQLDHNNRLSVQYGCRTL